MSNENVLDERREEGKEEGNRKEKKEKKEGEENEGRHGDILLICMSSML